MQWSSLNPNLQSSYAREIVATHEWTKLEEGDTIPAGLHIRMDLSTGEKWVKLIDNDKDKEKGEVISIVGEEGIFSAEVKEDGSVALIKNEDYAPLDDEETSQSEIVDAKPKYDFMMMHRTLSKLDLEERERMGLPDLPPHNASPEMKAQFEKQMEEIWTSRQKELAELEVADLPKILKQRIYSIQSYIQDGVISASDLYDEENETKVDQDEEEKEALGDIEGVLNDLEYQLSDLDNARDFHTLEGWQLLVSLLSDTAHSQALKNIRNSYANDTEIGVQTITDIETDYKQNVQAAAAWAIGTAVKNTHEFFPWAIQDISKLTFVSLPKTDRVSALDLLIYQFQKTFSTSVNSKTTIKLWQKIVYALGSLLRLNVYAQQHFLAIDGPEILGSILQNILEQPNPSKKMITLASKIVFLGSDIVTEARIDSHPTEDNNEFSSLIIDAFSTTKWCDSSPTLLNFYAQEENISSQENVMNIIENMAPVCRSIWDVDFPSLVENILLKWRSMEIDDEWKKEMVDLGERVKVSLEKS